MATPTRARRLLVPLVAFLAAACTNLTRVTEVHKPEGSTDTRDRQIDLEPRQTMTFAEEGVTLTDEFPGGRMGTAQRLEENVFQLTISPENEPINDSAWYALRATAAAPRTVELILGYRGGTHRYHPKISRDGERWESLEDARLDYDGEGDRAVLRLDLGESPTWIAAQEVVDSAALDRWSDDLARLPFVRRSDIGTSTEGRPLPRLEIGTERADAPVLVLLGRQHPPEVTGNLALQAFVEFLCSDKGPAREFRERFQTVVIPMLNPDGVDGGHWRHNARGVDLNRDWRGFHQQETRAARDSLLEIEPDRVVFAIDFHSTFEDIFYVLEGEGRETEWIEAIARAMPEYRFKIRPVDAEAPVAQNWLAATFGVPTVTYEVGDGTDRARLREIAGEAARALMTFLGG